VWRYIEAVKDDNRKRMSPHTCQSVAKISEEAGIQIATLYTWRKVWRLEGEVRVDSKSVTGFLAGAVSMG